MESNISSISSNISTTPITTPIFSSSNAEQAFVHFQDAFQTLNALRLHLFDFSTASDFSILHSTIQTSFVNPSSNISGIGIIHDISDFYPNLNDNSNTLLLSTLHGSLYDDHEESSSNVINDHIMHVDNEEENSEDHTEKKEEKEPEGYKIPNSKLNRFENSEVIDLTNESDSDNSTDSCNNKNVISIVDDRNEANAVRNIKISHMNQTMDFVPDERNSIRTIRKRIREIVNKHSEELLTFMIKPIDEVPIIDKLKRIGNRLNSPNFNPSASWIQTETNNFVDNPRMCETIQHQIGTSYNNLTNQLKNLHDSYHKTIKTMFELSESIDRKLDMIEMILESLKSLPNISESNPSSYALYKSIYDYVKYEMESCNIEKDYKEFIHQYGIFQKYKNLLKLASSSYVGVSESMKPPGSLCNICFTDNISYAMVPCGHTFCANCTSKTRYTCFICRSQINQKLKIFIE